MFTGIVEACGIVRNIRKEQGNLHLKLSCPFLHELKPDQSLSHNGVCLTVTTIGIDFYEVTAVQETLLKTNLGDLKTGDAVNLERCMPANGRFDGHIVQGHTDGKGFCTEISDDNGSWRIWFQHDHRFSELVVEKGSVCVNGVSLTVVDVANDQFSVAVIPYTWHNTNFHFLKAGDSVNLEFDVLGKYIRKMLNARLPT